MRNIILFTATLILAGFFTLNAQTLTSGNISEGNENDIEWEETIIDLGKIKYREAQEVVFKMKNKSNRPILITNSETSCGCTDAEYPHKPIAPGETVEISVTYEADDIGTFNKTITLTMNIEDSRQELHIMGEVTN